MYKLYFYSYRFPNRYGRCVREGEDLIALIRHAERVLINAVLAGEFCFRRNMPSCTIFKDDEDLDVDKWPANNHTVFTTYATCHIGHL